VRDEDFVLGFRAETDHRRRLQVQRAHAALALDGDPAAGAGVLQRTLGPRLDRQPLGADQLLAAEQPVDDPVIDPALPVVGADGFEIVVVLEIRIDVGFPVQLIDNEVQVLVLVRRHVLDQQRPGHDAAFDQRLVHAEHVAAPLRLVGTQRAGCVQHARRHRPPRAPLQPIGFGEIQNSVVALVPVLQALADLGFGCARFQAEERVREGVVAVVVLRGEVVGFRFPLLSRQLGVLEPLVHVVRDRPHVVEELGVHGPALVLVPQRLAHHANAGLGHGVPEQKLLALERAEAQALVPDTAFVRRLGRAAEPAFVDAAAGTAVSIVVVGVQFDALARMEKTTWNPGGCQPQQSAAGIQGPIQHFRHTIAFDDFCFRHGFSHSVFEKDRNCPILSLLYGLF